MEKEPLISVITVNLNNLQGLQETFKSVLNQSWRSFEFIIIDGGSSDGSKEFIESHQESLAHWVSEQDGGIYNAMNKGIKKATGEYVCFLNSGDLFYSQNTLATISIPLKVGYDICYGNVYLSKSEGKRELYRLPERLSFSFFFLSTITHQAAFIKKELFESVFYYNEQFRIVSDWEFFICAICKYNCSYKHFDKPVVIYDLNGISSGSNEGLLYRERDEVLCREFPLFMDDYNELIQLRQKMNTTRHRIFTRIEEHSLLGKSISHLLKYFNKD